MSSDWETIDSEDEMEQEGVSSGDEVDSEIWWPGKRKRAPPSEVSTLQHIALECIDNNFGTFVEAYSVSEDPVLRKGLEFLRRLYSSHFIFRKLENGVLDPEYFDLLLNEHLKELNFAIFHAGDFDLVLKRLKDVGHGIARASFYGMLMTDSSEEKDIEEFISKAIVCLPNVNKLKTDYLCTDETLQNIWSNCHELKELYIDGSKVTYSGLKHLCSGSSHASALKVLSLQGLSFHQIPFFSLLKHMPSLGTLHHTQSALMVYATHESDYRNNCLDTVRKYNLTSLSLRQLSYGIYSNVLLFPEHNCLLESYPNVKDILFVCSAVCPKVTTLHAKIMKAFHSQLISKFNQLENLTIVSDDESLLLDDFLTHGGEKLKSLTLEDNISFCAPALIRNCLQLEYLELRNISFGSINNAEAKRLGNLRKIILKELKFTRPFAEESVDNILRCSSNLEDLSFISCSFDGSGMNSKLSSYFQGCTLQRLKFYATNVDQGLLQTLILNCRSIKKITLDSCKSIRINQYCYLKTVASTMPNDIKITWYDDDSEHNYSENSSYEFDDDEDYMEASSYSYEDSSDGNFSDEIY